MQRIIVVIISLTIFSSCSNRSESDLAFYKSMQAGFTQSVNAFALSNQEIYSAIETRAKDFKTAPYAEKWQTRALLIKDLSTNAIGYIDSLIRELKIEAGVRMENFNETYKETFREDDRDAVEHVFVKNKRGKELQDRLLKYKDDMLAIDPEFFNMFGHTIINVSDSFFEKGFTKTYFENIPVIAAIALLRKYQSDIGNTECQFLKFCLNKTHPNVIVDDFISPLISQSSKYLKGGEEIEIEAGIGAFSVVMSPEITINGKTFTPNESAGLAKYKFKTPLKPGKYFIPVKIEYIAPDGTKQEIEKKVEYTVIE
jgi:gliding motility-associated protein GldM